MPERKRKKRARKPKKKQISPWALAGAAAALVLVVLIPHLILGGDRSVGAAVPEGYRHFVLDLSHHNRSVVWDSLKVVVGQDGKTCKNLRRARTILPLDAVVLKATEGLEMKDDRFAEYWEAARAAGLRRGAYHFFRTSTDPIAQARNYIGSVSLSYNDLPPVLDIETMHRGCTRGEVNRKAKQWLEAVKEHYGRTPVIYTSDSYARDILDDEIKRDYPLWIARYNSEPPSSAPWKLWQFTDKAVVYGVRGYADLSVCASYPLDL